MVEVVDAPLSIGGHEEPGPGREIEAGRLDRPGRPGRGRRAGRRARVRRQHRPDAGGRDPADQATARGAPARAGRAAPDPGRARAPPRRRRQRGGPARAPRAVRVHGRLLHGGRVRPGAAAGGAPVGRRGVGQGHARGARRARAHRGPGGLNFVGNVEGFDLPGAGADVVVTDGFTGNVALKVLEGTSRLVRDAIASAVRSSPVSALGGLLIRGRVGRLRERARPGGGRGSDPARPPQAGGGGPRQLRAAGHRQRGRPRPARRGRGHGRAHRRGARSRRGIAIRARW